MPRVDREYNVKLSLRRAKAIREALVTTFRVPGEYLFAVGLGEEQLRDPAKPFDGVNRGYSSSIWVSSNPARRDVAIAFLKAMACP